MLKWQLFWLTINGEHKLLLWFKLMYQKQIKFIQQIIKQMNYNVLAWTWYKMDFKLQQIIQELIKINWNKVLLSLLTIVTVNCARIRMKVWTVYEIFIQETRKRQISINRGTFRALSTNPLCIFFYIRYLNFFWILKNF